MKSQVSMPIAILVVVVVLLIAGGIIWKSQQRAMVPVSNEKGAPLIPAESQQGAKMMQDIFKSGKNRPAMTPPP